LLRHPEQYLLPVFVPLIERVTKPCKQSFRRCGIAAEPFLILDHDNLPADAPFSFCDAPIRSGEIAQSFVTVWHGPSIRLWRALGLKLFLAGVLPGIFFCAVLLSSDRLCSI
jgi:hypothetical protein